MQALARVESNQLASLMARDARRSACRGSSLPLNIAQSPIWGLGRVIAQEHPAFWGGLIDLDPNPDTVADSVLNCVSRFWVPMEKINWRSAMDADTWAV